ncbi:MAG: hypothetical protein Q4D79_01540 [Propionibacteriaceae bacterium]|nr:hypothetical protein [Propionibacteriaceae bacterium]
MTPDTPAPVSRRILLILLAGVSLLVGLNAGLVRLGVWAPVASGRVGDLHGPLMVLGFMGTLISLERAQALRNRLAYVAPALLGAGALVLISGVFPVLGQLLLFDGALALVAVLTALYRRAPLPLVGAQVLGALLACLAAGLLVRVELPSLLPLLAGFIVITIAAERAELAQLTMGRHAVPLLVTMSTWLALAAVMSLLWPDIGDRIFGAGALAVALWLIRDDVGRRLIRTEGLRRYNAAALLLGNVWLAVAGLTWLVGGRPATTGGYDVVVHATFLGFAMSMIMAHAPIIFPTVLARPLPYRPAMWLPLLLLHLGMSVRVVGALTETIAYRIGGVMTVASILLFALTAIASAVKA